MSQVETYDCFIIGGGITGLSAAFYIKDHANRVAIAEASVFSGEIKTRHQEGFTLECGPNVVALKPDLVSLLHELGLQEEITYPAIANFKQMVFKEGKAIPVPKGIYAFLKSQLFSLREKIHIIRGVFTKNVLKKGENITVKDLFCRIFGEPIVRRVIDPVLLGIFGGKVDTLSAKSIFPQLYRKMEGGDSFFSAIRTGSKRPKIAVLKSGMQKITERILEEIHRKVVLISQEVVGLKKIENLYEISFKNGTKALSRNVFICTSGKATSKYISEINKDLSENLKAFEAASLAVVHAEVTELPFVYKDSFGVLFPSSMNKPFLGVMFNSRLFPHLAPKGKELLTLCFGGMRHPDFISKSEKDIAEFAAVELREKLQIQNFRFINFQKWSDAIPQYELKHEEILNAFSRVEAENRGLFFCGADRGGIGVPDRVAAVKAALVDFIAQQ